MATTTLIFSPSALFVNKLLLLLFNRVTASSCIANVTEARALRASDVSRLSNYRFIHDRDCDVMVADDGNEEGGRMICVNKQSVNKTKQTRVRTGIERKTQVMSGFCTSSYFLSASSARNRASFSWFSRASMRSSSARERFSRILRALGGGFGLLLFSLAAILTVERTEKLGEKKV